MKKTILILLPIIGFFASCNQNVEEKIVPINNEKDSLSYFLGVDVADNFYTTMKGTGIDSLNMELFVAGAEDVLLKDTTRLDKNQARYFIQSFFTKIQEEQKAELKKQYEINLTEGQKFLEENSTKEGVVTTESGLQYKILKKGNGPKPKATDIATVHYHGTLIDGTVFDSSIERNEPAQFPINMVIPGWTEALQLMPKGSKWQLFIPQELAYADSPRPGGPIEPYMVLVFEVELLDFESQSK